MTIKLYKCGSDPKCVNKTLTDELIVSGVVREPIDMVNPVIEVQGSETAHMLEGYNYMVIEDFARAYFITVTPNSYDLSTITGHVDILSSARAWLLARTATITRNENLYSAYLNDPEFDTYAYRNIVTKAFPTPVSGDSIILMTVG